MSENTGDDFAYYRRIAHKLIKGSVTPGERRQLEEWYQSGQETPVELPASFAGSVEEHEQRLLAAILEKAGLKKEAPAKVRRISGRTWWAAASIILLLAAGAYFLLPHRPAQRPEVVTTVPDDVKPPATNRATVTLASGKTVYLDSAGNGTLAEQGNMKLVKMADGQIAYQYESASTPSSRGEGPDRYREGGEASYNTLTNPRGSKVIDMTLSDGSHVWLNAGSSITYPVAFTGDERKVSMTGEAYFEITPLSFRRGSRSLSGGGEAKKPFIVQKGDMQVTVLGTHFNVNAYDDEGSIKVTLLEGSVKTSNSFGDVMLRPGQQAAITKNQKPETRNNIDLEQVMAWKEGRFEFNGTNITAIMRQVSRWYGVDVEYKNDVSDQDFSGIVSRKENVSKLLKVLEATGTIRFQVEGGRILVMSR